MLDFSLTGNNNGQIVGKSAYFGEKGDKHKVADEVIKSQGGGKKYGFDSGLLVQMSVDQEMGGEIPTLEQNITNTNVRIGALTELSSDVNVFLNKTLGPLSDPRFLSGFDVSVGDPDAASAQVSLNSTIKQDTQFTLDVKQIATAQTISTIEIDPSQKLGTGKLEFALGKYGTDGKFTDNREGNGGTISIDKDDNIETLADKINDANMGITATVVQMPDGKARLAMYSNKTGANNAINISTENSALSKFAYNGEKSTAMYEQKVGANDAHFEVNGIDYITPTNNVKNVMGLDLHISSKTTNPTIITAHQDTKTLVGNVQFFVDNYNTIAKKINTFDDKTPGEHYQGSLHDTKEIQDIRGALSDLNKTLNANGASLDEIGIKMGDDGLLTMDHRKVEQALKRNPNIINQLFLNKNNTSTHSLTIADMGNSKAGGYYTQDGQYNVTIKALGAPMKMTTGVIKYPVVASPKNDTIKLTVNGHKIDIKLDDGHTYNADQLSLTISNQINRDKGMRADKDAVVVSNNADGSISIESAKAGSKHTLDVRESNTDLGFIETKNTIRGKDVVGDINGVNAIGDGNELSSLFDPTTKGLVIDVDKNIEIGKTETVTIQRGYLTELQSHLSSMVNDDKGIIKKTLSDYQKALNPNELDSLVSKLTDAQEKSDKLTKFYWQKYSNAESALSKSASVQNMLNTLYFSENKDK